MALELELLLAPLGSDSPAGPDIGRDPEFAELLLVVLEATSSGVAHEARWSEVARHAIELLGRRSKDLRVASLLARACIHERGLEGLVDGLALLRGLLERFRETLHPRPELARGESWSALLRRQLDDPAGALRDLDEALLEGSANLRLRDLEGEPPRAVHAAPAGSRRAWEERLDLALEHLAGLTQLLATPDGPAESPLPRLQARLESARRCLQRAAAREAPAEGADLLQQVVWPTHFVGDRNDTLEIELQFQSMAAFSPEELARQIPALQELLRTRKKLRAVLAERLGSLADLEPLLAELGISPRSPLDEDAQLTVYRPRRLEPEQWETLLAFLHRGPGSAAAHPDEPDPVAQVRAQAERLLGPEAGRFDALVEDAGAAIPRGAQITLVPELPGVEINPRQRSFLWLEPVHHEEFRVRAPARLLGQRVHGRLVAYLGPLVVAEVRLSMPVEAPEPSPTEEPTHAAEVARAYRRIFACYSHEDRAIVEACERTLAGVGDRFLRDVVSLRAGERWQARLEQLIEEADLFQLFWSSRAMFSPHVRQEWEHALSLGRGGFVRPVYWEDPLPRRADLGLPPPALEQLHFTRIPWIVAAPARSERAQQATGTAHRMLKRVRRPRLHLAVPRDRVSGAESVVELPYVVGVLADLGSDDSPAPERRCFVQVDQGNLDAVLRSARPSLSLPWPEAGRDLELAFDSVEDFASAAVEGRLAEVLGGADAARACRRVFADPAFQRLRSTWLGLQTLVERCETGREVVLRVLHLTRDELFEGLAEATLSREGGWLGALLRADLEDLPLGLLVGDYEFDHSTVDVAALAAMSRIAGELLAPFVAGASVALLGIASWTELESARRPCEVLQDDGHRAWQALREREDSRWVALTLPRVLVGAPLAGSSQVPRGARGEPHDEAVLISAAWSLAANVARSVVADGWPLRLCGSEGGGRCDLSWQATPGEGATAQLPALEARLSALHELQLSREGLIPLVQEHGGTATFFSLASVHRPRGSLDPREVSAALLAARLDVLLPTARIAHHLRRIAMDQGQASQDALQGSLERWLERLVHRETGPSSQEERVRRPFAAARVTVTTDEGVGELAIRLEVRGALTADVPVALVAHATRRPRA